MRLALLPRLDPVGAIRLWNAATMWWSDRWHGEKPDVSVRELTAEELVEHLLCYGCPSETLQKLGIGTSTPRREAQAAIRGLRDLADGLLPERRLCFEATANVDASRSAAMAALEGVATARVPAGDDDAAEAAMAYYGVTDDRRWTTARQVAILQAVAQQVATDGPGLHPETGSRTAPGAREVRLWADDAECLRSLARWQFEEPEARPGRVALIEYPRPVAPPGPDTPALVFPPAGLEGYESRWYGSPGSASSEGPPWVLARAAGFLVDLCMGSERWYIYQCLQPKGLDSYLDYLLGERSDEPPRCGAMCVAERGDAACCGRATCKQVQTALKDDYSVSRSRARRAEALARRAWKQAGLGGSFHDRWERAGRDLVTFGRGLGCR